MFDAGSERRLLRDLWRKWQQLQRHTSTRVIGFEHKQHDIPFLVTRSQLHDITVPSFDGCEFVDLAEMIPSHRLGYTDGRQREWRKGHILTGTNTHCIITATTTDKHRHDNTQIQELLQDNKIQAAQVEKFVADKAYNARNTFNKAHELGLIPYVPFRENTTAKMKGSIIWQQMYHEFHQNRQDFLDNYHQRSNVETVFHMIKQHFTDRLTTKTAEVRDVEAKIRFCCHNIYQIIHKIREENIDIDFTSPSCVKNKLAV